jgi:hypothetical protein
VATFSVEVLGDESGRGKIVAGDFVEYFQLELCDWSVTDYSRSWRRALEELVADVPAVALMTWCAGPANPIVRRAWTLYREAHTVFVQEQLFVPGDHRFELDPTGRVVNLPPRETLSDDGETISTWVTDLHAIGEFLR